MRQHTGEEAQGNDIAEAHQRQLTKNKRNAHNNRLKSAGAAAGLHLDSTEAQNRQTRSSHQTAQWRSSSGQRYSRSQLETTEKIQT